jgi:hypothetical protein
LTLTCDDDAEATHRQYPSCTAAAIRAAQGAGGQKMPIMADANDDERHEAAPLWGALDLILGAYAIALIYEPEAAHFAMMTALVIGERLGLSDHIVYRLAESAAAEARASHHRRSRKRAPRVSK